MRLTINLIVRARSNDLRWSLRRTELAFWHLTCDGRCCRRCNWLRSPLLTYRRSGCLRVRSDGPLVMLRLRWIWKPRI
jgi:hypothetical protein